MGDMMAKALESIKAEAAKPGTGPQIKYLAQGIEAMLGLHPEWAEKVAGEGKTLRGCLDEIRKGAKGNVSDPIQSTTAICSYYCIEVADVRRLALEVNGALIGGDAGANYGAPTGDSPAEEAQTPAREPEFTEDDGLDALLEGLM